uniref:Uncharacterized protein n=1 Tax=viral metagenome TaxID=1070528 RepID=A0A6M3LFC5_9ZZZZ
MDNSTVISIILGVVTLTFTMIVNYFAFVSKTNGRLTRLESRVDVFWKVLEPHLANIIHSPTHPRRDKLVDKLVNKSLTDGEDVELKQLLRECLDDCRQDQKLAASLLLARVESITDWKFRKKEGIKERISQARSKLSEHFKYL